MKKLYRKSTVHPSPPTISDQLSFLPATILTLTVALSPEDREVLAYLISSSSSSGANPRRTPKGVAVAVAGGADHPALFHCSCFRCYMSYWVRWDSSPNHQLIHEIIDAFEEWLAQTNKGGGGGGGGSSRKEKIQKKNKKGGGGSSNSNKSKRSELVKVSSPCKVSAELSSESVLGETETSINSGGGGGGGEVGEGGEGVEDDVEKGSVRRFVSFIGERIWGAWGQ